MIQRNFMIKSPLMAGMAIRNIKKLLSEIPHRDALLTVYESGYSRAQMKDFIKLVRACDKRLKVAGISLFSLVDMNSDGTGIKLNLILTNEAQIEVVDIPCIPGEESVAAARLRERLDGLPDAKAVELLCYNTGLNITRIMEEGASGHEDVGIFGTISSGSPPASVSARIRQAVNLFKIDGLAPSTEQLIIGNNILDSGFAAVIFSGKELHAKFNYALGWHPIGREMPIEPGRTQGLGESALARIDGMPAAQIYKEYLGVPTNSYLITNICEFPLLVRRGGTDICLIPFNYGDNGELYFSTSVYEGEKLRFSFASQDEILCASAESARSMEDFAPDALFLILCGNRINFLRDDASLEWNVFDHIAPDYALIHGASELFYINGSGGVMNSAHLAIGLREGDKPDNLLEHFEPGDYMHHEGFIPLSERMSVFLNKMTGQLIGVAKEAYAANQAKSAFLSNMSHEIRTPINAILGMDEMILRESGEPEIIKYAEDIRSAGNSLLGIVNDILDFSKIEAGKMNILPVEYEFLSVINDLYNMIRNRADKKGLKLELKVDPNIPSILYGDEIRIKQVITNILTNAVKYTEKGSVTLSVKRVDSTEHVTIGKDSDYHGEMCLTHPVILSVSVKDTGIGIKDSDKARLFGAFERLDEGHNRTIEGTGLGLNITRQLLELMGSTLNVKSTYGEGSVFSFDITQGIVRDIPIGEISERFAKTSAVKRLYHESFTAEAARILVVDDTSMNLEVMRGLLKKTRILIDTAESGDEALKLVTENAYDVIFLDHRMPGMDGIECFNRMKELPGHKSPDAPVIALTANAVSGAREKYLETGFSDYLTKPVDPDKLEEMLIRYLPGDKVHIIPRMPTDGSFDSEGTAKDSACAHTQESEMDVSLPEKLLNDPRLDTQAGIRNCGSVSGYLSILENFRASVKDKYDEIKKYYELEDWKSYTVKVHALKSSARTIGANALSEKAALLEEAGDNNDTERILKDTDELLKLLLSFSELLSPDNDAAGEAFLPPAEPQVIKDACAAISEFAGEQDYELVKMVLDSMKEYGLSKEDKERFERIRSALMRLDWDAVALEASGKGHD